MRWRHRQGAYTGPLWAFLPKFSLGQSFPLSVRRGNFPEAASKGVREIREQVTATRPLGTSLGRRAHPLRGGTEPSLSQAPRVTVPPAGFVCRGTKAAPVWGEWLGHLIRGSRSSFHTQREMHRGRSPRTSQPFSRIRWGQLCRPGFLATNSFQHLPATTSPPVASRGLWLGSHRPGRFHRTHHHAETDFTGCSHHFAAQPSTRFRTQTIVPPQNSIGVPAGLGSHLMWAPMSSPRRAPLSPCTLFQHPSGGPPASLHSAQHLLLTDSLTPYPTPSPPECQLPEEPTRLSTVPLACGMVPSVWLMDTHYMVDWLVD